MIKKNLYKGRVLLLIIFFSVLRGFIASSVDLGNDESYYWFFSQVVKLNYFDHPGMVAIWTRIFTLNLLLENYEIFLRLGSIVGCGLSSWFIYKCVTTLSSEKAGWFAACLYNASFYAGITAGLFIFPDAPQMVFYTFSLWMIAKITTDDTKWAYWILFGIGSGLCIMSKVHGAFIWIGLGLYILFLKRSLLTNPRLYAALVIALAITSPVLVWNIQHDFLAYRFHSERIYIHGFSLNWYGLLAALFGQLMINNPFNMLIILFAVIAFCRHRISRLPALYIYNFIGIPLGLLLLFISLYRTTLPHWSGPAFITLIPLAAIWLAQMSKKIYLKLIPLSLGANILFMISWFFVINFFPGNLGSKIKFEQGKGDLSLDMYGWKEAGKRFDSLYQNEAASGVMPKNSPVICYKWWGAHIEYYFCRPIGIQMIGLGKMNELHEYMWMNEMRKDKVNLSGAYCIVNSDDYYDVYDAYNNYYSQIDTITQIQILRGNKPSHNFTVFRLSGWKNNMPVIK